MWTALDRARERLDEIADQTDFAVIGPRDSRVQEIATTTFPWNTICHVERDFGDGRWRGCSGVLVAPRLVLTAGHCLYNHLLRRAPARVRVSPGRRDRDTRPYGSHLAERVHAAAAYRTPPRGRPLLAREHDWGLVVLTRAVPGIDRFMRLHVPTDAELESLRRDGLVTVAGYPGDRPIGTMWRHTERLHESSGRRVAYTVDTCPGHSGSPIWYGDASTRERRIIGVHTSGVVDERGRSFGCSSGTVLAPVGMRNTGVRITPMLLSELIHAGGDAARPLAQVRGVRVPHATRPVARAPRVSAGARAIFR